MATLFQLVSRYHDKSKYYTPYELLDKTPLARLASVDDKTLAIVGAPFHQRITIPLLEKGSLTVEYHGKGPSRFDPNAGELCALRLQAVGHDAPLDAEFQVEVYADSIDEVVLRGSSRSGRHSISGRF